MPPKPICKSSMNPVCFLERLPSYWLKSLPSFLFSFLSIGCFRLPVGMHCQTASDLSGHLGMHHSCSRVLAASKVFGLGRWSVPTASVCLLRQQRSEAFMHATFAESPAAKAALLFFCFCSSRPSRHAQHSWRQSPIGSSCTVHAQCICG